MLLHECRPVAAKRVAIDDVVARMVGRENGPPQLSLSHIKNVKRVLKHKSSGLIAPATASGTLLVDGVFVSQFSTFPIISASLDSSMHSISQGVVAGLAKAADHSFIAALAIEKTLNALRSLAESIISMAWIFRGSLSEVLPSTIHPVCPVSQLVMFRS